MLCKLMRAKAKLSLRLYIEEEEGKTTSPTSARLMFCSCVHSASAAYSAAVGALR